MLRPETFLEEYIPTISSASSGNGGGVELCESLVLTWCREEVGLTPSLPKPSNVAWLGILGKPNEYRLMFSEDGMCSDEGRDVRGEFCDDFGARDPTRRRLKRDSLVGEGRGAVVGPSRELERTREETVAVEALRWCERGSVGPYRAVNEAEWCRGGAGDTRADAWEAGREPGRELGREPGRVLNDAIREAIARAKGSARVVFEHSVDGRIAHQV
jgi:hypothetical protein